MAVHKPLHKHAFWLFGVLVGLAIKDALEATIPHLVDFAHIQEFLTAQQLRQPQAYYSFYPDLARLVLFLILIVRFYVGSTYYFGDVYGDENQRNRDLSSNKVLDQLVREVKRLSANMPSFLKGAKNNEVEEGEEDPLADAAVIEEKKEFEKTNYSLDFVSSFMHFLGFVLLG